MQDAQNIKRSKYEMLFHSDNKRLENAVFHSLSLHSLIPDGLTSSPVRRQWQFCGVRNRLPENVNFL